MLLAVDSQQKWVHFYLHSLSCLCCQHDEIMALVEVTQPIRNRIVIYIQKQMYTGTALQQYSSYDGIKIITTTFKY